VIVGDWSTAGLRYGQRADGPRRVITAKIDERRRPCLTNPRTRAGKATCGSIPHTACYPARIRYKQGAGLQPRRHDQMEAICAFSRPHTCLTPHRGSGRANAQRPWAGLAQAGFYARGRKAPYPHTAQSASTRRPASPPRASKYARERTARDDHRILNTLFNGYGLSTRRARHADVRSTSTVTTPCAIPRLR